MSDLDIPTLLDHVSRALGDIPTTTVSWTTPLAGTRRRPQPALSQAVGTLQDGGVLAVQIQSGYRTRLDPDEATAALLSEVHLLGVPVEGVESAWASGGPVVLLHLLAVEKPRAELEAVSNASLYDLSPRLVDALSRHAPAVTPEDEPWSRSERALLALGAAVEHEGEVVPTVAGLVALGRSPARHIAGMQAVVHGARSTTVSGSIESLPQRVVRSLHLQEPGADAVRMTVTWSLSQRSWSPRHRDEPLVVVASGGRVEVRWPASEEGNPTLEDLLRLRRVDSRALDLEELADWLVRCGGREPSVERVGEEVRVRLVLPRRRRSVPRVVRAQPRIPEVAPAEPEDGGTESDEAPVDTHQVDPPTPFVAADQRDAAILAYASERDSFTTKDIIEDLVWTRSTTRSVLARLVREGALLRASSSPRSPVQAYRLTDGGKRHDVPVGSRAVRHGA